MFGLEQLYGFFKREVITVEILHVVTHLKDVVDDAAIDGLLKEMLRFEYHVVATQNAFAVGIADELIHQSQATQVFLKVCRIFVNGELVAVVVSVFEAELGNDALGHTFSVVGREGCCVFCYKIVGHDATTAIDDASDAGFILLSCLMNAVLTEELAPFVTCDEIHLILFRLPFHVGFLDATSRRGVITCDGQMDQGTVSKFNRLLHKTLSKGATSYDDASVVVLNGTREDFCSRSGRLINEYDER